MIPPVFKWLSETGSVNTQAMYNTFNMGIGFVVIVPKNQAQQTISFFESHNIAASNIGEIISGNGELIGL